MTQPVQLLNQAIHIHPNTSQFAHYTISIIEGPLPLSTLLLFFSAHLFSLCKQEPPLLMLQADEFNPDSNSTDHITFDGLPAGPSRFPSLADFL